MCPSTATTFVWEAQAFVSHLTSLPRVYEARAKALLHSLGQWFEATLSKLTRKSDTTLLLLGYNLRAGKE